MDVTWLNWSWLPVILSAAGIGFGFGMLLARLLEDEDRTRRLVGTMCIVVAIAAWTAAFFHVVPLATNAIAFGALAVRAGLTRRPAETVTQSSRVTGSGQRLP